VRRGGGGKFKESDQASRAQASDRRTKAGRKVSQARAIAAIDDHSRGTVSNYSGTSRVRTWTRLGTIIIVIVAGACGSSDELPTVRRPGETTGISDRGPLRPLTERDHATISALIREQRKLDGTTVSGRPPVLLVSDVTLKWCPDYLKRPDYVPPHAIRQIDPKLFECVPLHATEYLERHPEWGPHLTSSFSTALREARQISASLGDKVVLLSLTDHFGRESVRRFSVWELLQRYPPGASFIQFGAPIYPSPRRALVFYRVPDSGGGFVYLVRSDGQWVKKGYDGWTE
jgi:hypothetical protein